MLANDYLKVKLLALLSIGLKRGNGNASIGRFQVRCLTDYLTGFDDNVFLIVHK